jgi:hypothetical protein
VAETQFETLENDSQAIETQPTREGLASATSDRLVQHDNTNTIQLPTVKNDEAHTSFFSNPRDNIEAQDVASSFKFGAANKPVAGQFNRRVLNVGMSSSADIATISDKTTLTQPPSVECERPHPASVKMSDKTSAATPAQNIAVRLPQKHDSSGNKPLGPVSPLDRTGTSDIPIFSILGNSLLQRENNPVVDLQESVANAGNLAGNPGIKTANLASGSAPQGMSTCGQHCRPTKQRPNKMISDPVHRQESALSQNHESQEANEKIWPPTVFSRHASTSVPPANLQTHHHVVPVNSSLITHGMPVMGASDELPTRAPSKILPQSEMQNCGGIIQKTSGRQVLQPCVGMMNTS